MNFTGQELGPFIQFGNAWELHEIAMHIKYSNMHPYSSDLGHTAIKHDLPLSRRRFSSKIQLPDSPLPLTLKFKIFPQICIKQTHRQQILEQNYVIQFKFQQFLHISFPFI